MSSRAREPACGTPRSDTGSARIVSLIYTAVISAALFSMAIFAEGSLAWLGVLGIVPIALRVLGCPGCGGCGPAPPPSA